MDTKTTAPTIPWKIKFVEIEESTINMADLIEKEVIIPMTRDGRILRMVRVKDSSLDDVLKTILRVIYVDRQDDEIPLIERKFKIVPLGHTTHMPRNKQMRIYAHTAEGSWYLVKSELEPVGSLPTF